jgi:hypothetical protein
MITKAIYLGGRGQEDQGSKLAWEKVTQISRNKPNVVFISVIPAIWEA